MKKIYNISRKESLAVYPKIMENGNDLLSISKVAGEKGRYGIALSLLVLGAEEYTKAIILLLNGHGVNVFDVKELRQAFHIHKRKHEVAILLELTSFIESIMKFEEWNKKRKERKKKNKLPWLDRFILSLKDSIHYLQPIVNMGFNIDWWDKADYYKNRGFYVDYMNELNIPNNITQQDVQIAIPVIRELKKRYRILRIMFAKLPNEEIESFVNQLNEGISLYEVRK